jgi:aspartate aminotransferase-like enzyme
MLQVGRYVFKCADTKDEFEQIHRLNHQTFVGEIPQHADDGTGSLVDKFHAKSAYFIVLKDGQLVGMVSAHDQPPFSVSDRLPDPTILSKFGARPLEVRLLAVELEERNSNVFFGLIYTLYSFACRQGYTDLFISGVETRLNLYRRLGFQPLGPAVPCGGASFVPMVLKVGQLPFRVERIKRLWESHINHSLLESNGVGDERHSPICLLPGPVTVAPAVRDAFHRPAIYHRGPEFIDRFVAVRQLLGQMVGGRDVAILNGSGTLANESIAATLAAIQAKQSSASRGLLLINGEFGQRLAQQATRFGLNPVVLEWPWGQPWDLDEVDKAIDKQAPGTWVWGVHQESSTGVLNDLPGLVRVARLRGARVCVDCISSLGATQLDLRNVFLASGATGKALGAFAGAALIFADAEALQNLDRSAVPSYFDIPAALASAGPCYTFPSATLFALEAALQEYSTPKKAEATYARYKDMGAFVRHELRNLNLTPLAREDCACPVVTTFTPPGDESSTDFVARCSAWGYAIGGQSAYLAARRYVQIATMGAVTPAHVRPLFARLARLLVRRPTLALAD